MSVKEKRVLNKDEHVDHKDNNKSNDDIDNLQILSLKENNIKQSKCKGKKMVVFKCPYCNNEFEKPKRQTHLQKGGTYTGCSRKCSTTFGALLQHYPNDKNLQKALNDNVIKEYVKYE